jgi:hypothetical protein
MKKVILFIVLINLPGLVASGQTRGAIKGGLNLSEMIFSNQPEAFGDSVMKPYLGYHAGCVIQDDISRHLALKAEILFSRTGFVTELEGGSTTISLNYLTWPFLLVYKAGERVEAESGIDFGYLVSARENYHSLNVGINVGLVFMIIPQISAGLRYNLGIPSKMLNIQVPAGIDPPKYQHSVLQMHLGFNLMRNRNKNSPDSP